MIGFLTDVVDRDDVGVIEASSDLRFIDEALDCGGLLTTGFRQELYGDAAVEQRVFRLIDLRHSAEPNQTSQSVLAEALPDAWVFFVTRFFGALILLS